MNKIIGPVDRLLVKPTSCGLFHKNACPSRISDTTFPLFLEGFHRTNRVSHSPLRIGTPNLGVVGPTVVSEGHPRCHGDGPLTTNRSHETKGG